MIPHQLWIGYTATVRTASGEIVKKPGQFWEQPLNWGQLTGPQRIAWWKRKVVRDGKAATEADVLGVEIRV